MKKYLGLSILLLLSGLPAMAQDTPLGELGVGYTYRSLNVPFSPRLGTHGWNASVVFNVNNWVGVATDVDGTRGSQPDLISGTDKQSTYTVLVGPRIYPLGHHRLTPFAHVLFGLAHGNTLIPTTEEGPGGTVTDGSFAFAVGGGLDVTVNQHFGVRLVEFDYERTGMFQSFAPGTPDQNNYKIKAGILIRFGKK